ncbi:MAG: hypothetical protein QMD73_11420 [Rhodocyclaceae bacterium]|uniref:hypothetical protein n=1 Tax=Sulfuricystis thermophila TaxID=2496847 RepID=UPI00103689E2|nr:hypothetical protein [Sulfuricystis thermophila]MDI6750775.1 hypothetical protein [Rhodocyclaceae bacterium]
MPDYTLNSGVYVNVTPAGVYRAVAGNQNDAARALIGRLLSLPETPLLDQANLAELAGGSSEADFVELLYRLQELGWLAGSKDRREAPDLNMERDVPRLLAELSGAGKALLADSQGFYLANVGFVHEVVEELAALAASIASLQARHSGLLDKNLRLPPGGWAAVDAAGNGQLGFWPLLIGNQKFVLSIAGTPAFDRPAFVDLVWWLSRRYAALDFVST